MRKSSHLRAAKTHAIRSRRRSSLSRVPWRHADFPIERKVFALYVLVKYWLQMANPLKREP